MIKIERGTDCCGCEACAQACPKQCIDMQVNKEGFYYPVVDSSLCIDCKLCERVCPWLNTGKSRIPLGMYLFQNKSQEVLLNSSSGGAFTALANECLSKGGVVFGVIVNDNGDVLVQSIEAGYDLSIFGGSKYVQCRVNDAFIKCRDYLKEGREVLYSGTPCQIAGLKQYLGKNYENLITVDFICHGVPSPGVWKRYCEEKEIDCKENVRFRDKRNGWKRFGLSYTSKEGKELYKDLNNDAYLKGFIGDVFLRQSCYECRAKSFTSGSDITMGDAWGVWNYGVSDDKGTSVLVANTNKGKELMLQLDLLDVELDEDFLRKHNPSVYVSVPKTRKRKLFYNKIKQGLSVEKAVWSCFPPTTYLDKVIWSVKKRLRKYGLMK